MASKKQSNIVWKLIVALMLCGIFAMTGMRLYEWWLNRQAHFVRYDAFGIEVPINYEIHGIDVSRYQHVINWESVRDMNVDNIRIGFAFIKATEGNGNRDQYFKRNWKNSREAGVPRGAYHFFLATKSGKTQAENYIATVELQPGDLPPVLDVEQTYGVGGETVRQRVREWLATVEYHYGIKPIIYTNVDFYKRYLKDDFDEYPLWVAHYLQKERPRIYRSWNFWQYSEQGQVNGIFNKVDFNVFKGDSVAFRDLLYTGRE